MLRFELIDNIQSSLAAYDFIIWTNFLNTGTHFHADHSPFRRVTHCLLLWVLPLAVRNPTLRKIVRRQFYGNAVPWHDADEVLTHFAGDVSYNLMAVLEFYPKLSPWKGLDDCSCELDYFLVGCHKYN